MARITKQMVMRSVDIGIDAFVKAMNSELERSEPSQQVLIPPAETTQGQKISQLIKCYVLEIQKKFGPKARPDLGGKQQGVLLRLLKTYTVVQGEYIIRTYLSMSEPKFEALKYDLVTMECNLQSILLKITATKNGNNLDKAAEIIRQRDQERLT